MAPICCQMDADSKARIQRPILPNTLAFPPHKMLLKQNGRVGSFPEQTRARGVGQKRGSQKKLAGLSSSESLFFLFFFLSFLQIGGQPWRHSCFAFPSSMAVGRKGTLGPMGHMDSHIVSLPVVWAFFSIIFLLLLSLLFFLHFFVFSHNVVVSLTDQYHPLIPTGQVANAERMAPSVSARNR